MNIEAAAIRSAYVVDRALRAVFPQNYFLKCMYASYAMQHVLRRLGYEARIITGSFGMFMVTPDARKASIEGFGGKSSETSHFWCVVGNRILDVSSPYLADSSGSPKARPPIVFWPIEKEMLRSFRYFYAGDLDPNSPETYDDHMKESLNQIIAESDRRLSGVRGQPKLSNWILRDMASIRQAAKTGDTWAAAAMRLEAGEGQVDFREIFQHRGLKDNIPVL